MIAYGDQLGAQLTTLAALMYVGIVNDQEVVFWKELRHFRRGFQFFDVFDIDGVNLIGRCNDAHSGIIDAYCKRYKHMNSWKKQMKRIYKSRVYSKLDKVVYRLVASKYKDFDAIVDLHHDVATDTSLLNLSMAKNYDIKNGFGTYRDWESYADTIISRFHFKKWVSEKGDEIYSRVSEGKKCVAVHFRRTDYLVLASLNLGDDYYEKAMNMFESDSVRFVVFSDDINGCKEMGLFKNKDVVFMDNNKAAVDMYLMSKMQGVIIANSTFSVWGALLNKNVQQVVCPYDFIGANSPQYMYINGNYYPRSWIAI